MNRYNGSLRALTADTLAGANTLVEIGTRTLKVHTLYPGYLRTVKHPYRLGHEAYGTGNISARTVQTVADIIGRYGAPQFAIATSGVRDAHNSELLALRIRDEFNVKLEFLSCHEESAILARAYLSLSLKLPALVADIGGGKVRVVFLNRRKSILWDSHPIGVIQLYYKWRTEGLSAMGDWIDAHLRKGSILTSAADRVFASGDMTKAIVNELGKSTFDENDVAELQARVRSYGAPAARTRGQADVFLPGLILTRKLLESTRVESIHYLRISVGRRALQERLSRVFEGPMDGNGHGESVWSGNGNPR